jgi:hypothetical protein
MVSLVRKLSHFVRSLLADKNVVDVRNIDRAIAHPSWDVPMKAWWEGVYEHVFIVPHPFFRVPGEPVSFAREYESREGREAWPEFRSEVKKIGEPVSWQEVHRLVAPEVPREKVYREIWLFSAGLGGGGRSDADLEKKLQDFCEAESLFSPEEDGMPAILEPEIGQFLSQFEVASVRAWDEFRENSFDLALSLFESDKPDIPLPKSITSNSIWGLHVPEPGVLLTWEFDATVAIIAMTDAAMSHVHPEEFFEGWYADESTFCDVFSPRDSA